MEAFIFGTLLNAPAYSILPISDGGLRAFLIHPECGSQGEAPRNRLLASRGMCRKGHHLGNRALDDGSRQAQSLEMEGTESSWVRSHENA